MEFCRGVGSGQMSRFKPQSSDFYPSLPLLDLGFTEVAARSTFVGTAARWPSGAQSKGARDHRRGGSRGIVPVARRRDHVIVRLQAGGLGSWLSASWL